MFAKGINVITENKSAYFISYGVRGLTTEKKRGSSDQCGENSPGREG